MNYLRDILYPIHLKQRLCSVFSCILLTIICLVVNRVGVLFGMYCLAGDYDSFFL